MGENNITTLPMSQMKQSALIGHSIQNQDFFLLINKKIKNDWFIHPYHSKIYLFLVKFYEKFNRCATLAELKNVPEITLEEPKVKQGILSFIDIAISDATQIGIEVLKPELIDFMHAKILHSALEKSAQSWNTQNFRNSALILEDAVKNYYEAKMEDSKKITFSNYNEYFKEEEICKKESLTTGLSLLDEALVEEGERGGLFKGDSTIILAPVNIGKTTSVITMLAHNIRNKKDVLFMTHEGRPSDIRLKILRSVLNRSKKEILEMQMNPQGIEKLNKATTHIDRYLHYEPYVKAGMCVEEILPIIRRIQDQRKLKYGKGFDLFACDYPALLDTERASKGYFQVRDILAYIYKVYASLSEEMNWHSLLIYQTNREGSKINKGISKETNRFLRMEDCAESFNPMQTITNVISLNRSNRDQDMNRIIFFVDKTRSGPTGRAVVARCDFSRSRTHSEQLGSVSYFGSKSMGDKVEEYLKLDTKKKLTKEEVSGDNE